jgi:antitoxin MazE
MSSFELTIFLFIQYSHISRKEKDRGAIIIMATIGRWENSAAIKIPRHILSQANLEEGSDIEILLRKEGEITLRAVRKRKRIEELFTDYNEDSFESEEIDWGKPQGNEL